MTEVYNTQFISILGDLAKIMDSKGEPFRARAYRKALESIKLYPSDITSLSQIGTLPGIGKTIMAKLEEYLHVGSVTTIEKYKTDPVVILTKVYGIGPKKAAELIQQGIDSIEKLLINQKGLTSAQKLGLQYLDDIEQRIPREEIIRYKDTITTMLTNFPSGTTFEIVGSFRRGATTSGDIDVIITNRHNNIETFNQFMDALISSGLIMHVLTRGDTKSMTLGHLPGEGVRRIDFMYSPPMEYAFAILYFTGSKDFNTAQRQCALDMGFTLNEHGLHNMVGTAKGNKVTDYFPTEKSIFDYLDMEFKEPADRINGQVAVKIQRSARENIRLFQTDGATILDTLSVGALNEMITIANALYYDKDCAIMGDDYYDYMKEYILYKFPKNRHALKGHTSINMATAKNKVTLPYELWSMDKIKPDTTALAKWGVTYKGPYVLSCKLDGISALYSTENKVPTLYTRGNGVIGQDISHMIPYLTLPPQGGVVIRGELIMKRDIFNMKYLSEFKNPRNMVGGVVNQKTIRPELIKDIEFVSYEMIKPSVLPAEQMKILSNLKIKTVTYMVTPKISTDTLIELLMRWKKECAYEIDGVICCNNEIYPRTHTNPDHAFAFKMNNIGVEATVINVLWAPSMDGYLKPRVQIEPIMLGGVRIEYATGFNGKFIESNSIGIGTIVMLVRSGDVIPHILSVKVPSDKPLMPDIKYKWNDTRVDIELLDKSTNDTVNEKIIVGFFKGLEVAGLGPGNVHKLIHAGYDTVPKILSMTRDHMMCIDGFKHTLTEKIYTGIHDKIMTVTLPALMDASHVFGRGFGMTKCRTIIEEYPNIINSDLSDSDKIALLVKINGMALKSSTDFVRKLPDFKAWVREAKLDHVLVVRGSEVVIKSNKKHDLYGKRIAMTGFRDKALSSTLLDIGAINATTVSSSTYIVLVKDLLEESGKADQARKLGITLMSSAEFKTKYNLT